MSFVLDQIRRIDAQLDRVQLASISSSAATTTSPSDPRTTTSPFDDEEPPKPSPHLLALQTSIRALTPSLASDRRALLQPSQILPNLSALSPTINDAPPSLALPAVTDHHHQIPNNDPYETELEWLLVSKATTQTYGYVLAKILDHTVGLAEDLWYWDEILGSRRWTTVYGVQSSPARIWAWGGRVWEDVKARGGSLGIREGGGREVLGLGERWAAFYGVVRQVVRERSVEELRHGVLMSPVTRLRGQIRRKRAVLGAVRLRNANALGVLLGEGLANESVHGEGLVGGLAEGQGRWKTSVARNVALMEAVLLKANDQTTAVEKFDAAVAELTDDDPLYGAEVYEQSDVEGGSGGVSVSPQAVAERLTRVLALALPEYDAAISSAVREHGKPSRLVRYWLPVTVGILSSSTILRILVNRQAEIVQWIEDLGSTVIDFWRNWVIEPTRKVIKTIRHDGSSEVSLMSKRSLQGDRDSLERMVVDFAISNPVITTGTNAPLTEPQIADLRLKVREGDLTPVLKAYEHDLATPILATLRGNLLRTLLIQVQKTKVDVEIAMGGIDALLKSQELVFGFVGLTPGILVTYFGLHYLRSSLTSKRGARAQGEQGKLLRQLRNIDRVLQHAEPTEFGELGYRDLGLLLCEVQGLRSAAEGSLPRGRVAREFGEDVEELCDVRVGVGRQKAAAERVRWAYGRYLS
ncbi:Nuclear control of ATPase protein 2 [Friedmanniomyces endolithicus]|uniref:Nuclear control of ATPase protein 2 n=1 Tax=Friedmanniomyces endolithicus TaxID=329885 RepID=A0AAN6QLB8_9PEZI|nr:Nuclear control of ATPase protein 2 [Friedmanniomyces endolithicus]KAK0273210.1 Nuclear control of ATPase protein 2 [Friedmanniomyces endolithicus]KAK0904951.1 Nuclear control of ATPase protein 2 [Friedmanniomyces endolithicus]KAK0970668.1 Nuclear control of ATPase protein 2 [Friedmanniomyces endolithicus]KAK0977031.1 Nuclear control of ATPase protein 2 [Friedmanniomyces endolithicus]